MAVDNQVVLLINFDGSLIATMDGIVGQEVLLHRSEKLQTQIWSVPRRLSRPSPSTGRSKLPRKVLHNILNTLIECFQRSKTSTYHVLRGEEGIVHSDDLNVVASEGSAEDETSNTSKAVDTDLDLTHLPQAKEIKKRKGTR